MTRFLSDVIVSWYDKMPIWGYLLIGTVGVAAVTILSVWIAKLVRWKRSEDRKGRDDASKSPCPGETKHREEEE